uniref:Bm10472 n=1 Tax=Brugia malayi TaxID=6279 RepID=A0A1I9G6P1_BRUMA|nr:Bm10472 [Brugia malayi]
MWKLLRIENIKICKSGEDPLEVNDDENHLEPNNKGNMKIPETKQNTEKLKEPNARRTRSNTKRQSQSKEVSVYTRSPTTIPAIKCKNITRTMCTKAFL